jgi:hypothetical protein
MRRLYSFILILTLAFAVPAFAQQRWERSYGGRNDDVGYSVQQTSDGGYVIAGQTSSFGAGGWDVWLIKTNAFGDTLWTRAYGGAGFDAGYYVQQTQDGGYIVAGGTFSFGNGNQVYLIKTNALGDTLWTKTYGGAGDEVGLSVQQTSDTGYIVAGTSNSFGKRTQVYLIKTNSAGNTLWTRTFGGVGEDQGWPVQKTTDNGYIVTGGTKSFGNGYQVYLIKTNASGATLWSRTYGGRGTEWGHSVQQTLDGGYIVAGYTTSFGKGEQVYVIKTNAHGDTLWTRTYGGTGSDHGWSVQQTSDGGYIVAGKTGSFVNAGQVYLIKTNASGDTLWSKTYGETGDDAGHAVQQTTDGGYIVAGWTYSFGNGNQVYLIKTDKNGIVKVK